MPRQPLLNLLHKHVPADAHERTMTDATIQFVRAHPDAFERSLLIGHVTGSAWIVSADRQQTVLIHHRKLDRWLQPGGHADGDPDMAAVAQREADEETGLNSLRLLSPDIFDVDIHEIPARGDVPAHLHYDVRFLFGADPAEPFVHSSETNGIRWVRLTDVANYTTEESVLRMVRKMRPVHVL